MQITLHPLSGVVLLAVEMPEDAFDFGIAGWDLWYCVDNDRDWINLPPGTWEFIGTTDTITSQQAHSLVSRFEPSGVIVYEDYSGGSEYFLLANESLRSCIIAAGGDEKTRYAILKQKQ